MIEGGSTPPIDTSLARYTKSYRRGDREYLPIRLLVIRLIVRSKITSISTYQTGDLTIYGPEKEMR